jgi:hypothetical protein
VGNLRLAAAALPAIKDNVPATWRFGNNVINLIKNGESPMNFFEKVKNF